MQNTSGNQPGQNEMKNAQAKQGQGFAQNQQQTISNDTGTMANQAKGPEMNERDFINDLLATEKYLTDSFNIFAREASNEVLFQDVLTILNETQQNARNIFNAMFKKGWYQLTAAPVQEIQQATQQFKNYESQFPYQ